MSAITGVPPSITTPDTVESRLGTLAFIDGAPTPETAERLYDHLDLVRGVEAYLNSIQGAFLVAIRRGFLSAGVEDNQVLMYPELMDSASLFLTANSDTVYFWTFIDVTNGPVVVDVPAMPAPSAILGTVDDMWFRVGGYEFMDPPPQITAEGVRPSESDEARKLNSRIASSTRRPASRRPCACV